MSDFYRTQGGRKFYEGTMPRIADALERVANELEARRLSEGEIERIAAFWVDQMGDVFYDADEFNDSTTTNEAIGERVHSCVVQAIKEALRLAGVSERRS